MGSQDFYSLSPDEQVESLETLARKALANWGLATAEIWLLKYRENCVFGVYKMATGTKYALRVHRPGYHNEAALNSELQWMEALHKDGVQTPEVIRTQDGRLSVTVGIDEVPETRVCDVLGWVEGEVLGTIEGEGKGEDCDMASLEDVRANHVLAGKMAASVHNQAEGWTIPEGFERPIMDAEGLAGVSCYLGDWRTHPHLTQEQLDLLNQTAIVAIEKLEAFGKTPDRFGLTHADFLPENLLIDNGNVRIIDFDDCGFGWYMMDLATALFFLLGEDVYDPAFEGLIEGYRSRRELPDEHLAMLPIFLFARSLCYVGWVATRQETAEFTELSPMLIEAAVALSEGVV